MLFMPISIWQYCQRIRSAILPSLNRKRLVPRRDRHLLIAEVALQAGLQRLRSRDFAMHQKNLLRLALIKGARPVYETGMIGVTAEPVQHHHLRAPLIFLAKDAHDLRAFD